MFNLLRMDLYRIIRSKSLYVCFGILLFMTFISFGLWFLVATPQGLEMAAGLGLKVEVMGRPAELLEDVDFLRLFRQIGLDGGSYSTILGIWVMLFVCADFQSGFIKNVMALYQNRWNYIGSKVLAAAIVNGCYLILHLVFALLFNQLFGRVVPGTNWTELMFYLGWAWLVTTAFASFLILVCVLTRSVAAGAVAAIVFGSGMAAVLLYSLFDLLNLADWLQYTIYMTLAAGPGKYGTLGDLYPYATGVGFLALYGILAGIVMKKRDI